MWRRRHHTLATVLLSFLVGLTGATLLEGSNAELRLEPLQALPEGLPEVLKDHLDANGFRVLQGEEVLAEFWLRTELPWEGEDTGELGITFGRMTLGALVGAAHFPNGWTDYRENDLDSGLYTLRYAVQPANGDHLGVSVYRDFFLLARADADTHPHKVYDDQEEFTELSQTASQKVHPAVLSLFPVYEDVEGSQVLRNEIDQWTLAIKVGDEVLGLVLLGHGEL